MRTFLILVSLIFCSVCNAIELDPVVAKNASVESLLQKKCIYLEAEGGAEMSMDMASGLLGHPDMLETVQRAYEEMLPEGESAEFTVKKVSEGKYSYVNRHNQQTEIEEVARTVVPGEKVLVALYAEGRRFFGEYRSLVQVEVCPAAEGGVQYAVCVYAYPESRMLRTFAKLPGVERFFRKKTIVMTQLTLSICQEVYKSAPAPSEVVDLTKTVPQDHPWLKTASLEDKLEL